MAVCSKENCEFETYQEDLCIFHCPKESWFEEGSSLAKARKQKLFSDFYEKLAERLKGTVDWNFTGEIFPELNLDKLLKYNTLPPINFTAVKCAFLTDFILILPDQEEMGKVILNACNFHGHCSLHPPYIAQLKIFHSEFNQDFFLGGHKDSSGSINYSCFDDIEIIGNRFSERSQTRLFYIEGDTFRIANTFVPPDRLYVINSVFAKNFTIQFESGDIILDGVDISNAKKDFECSNIPDFTFNNVKWGDKKKMEADRDTFRQLKVANDKQGNYIDANGFYAREMEEYGKELKNQGWKTENWTEQVVFGLGKIVSDHSASWIWPLFWFFLAGLIFFRIGCPCPPALGWPESETIDNYFAFINPLSRKSVFEGHEASWFFFKAISAFLIYHFVVSLRRQTKR